MNSIIHENFQLLLNKLSQTLGEGSVSLVSALAVLVLGWLFAAGFSKVLKVSLSKIKLTEHLGKLGGSETSQINIEELSAKTVYYVLLLFVSVAFFQVLGLTLITQPLNKLLDQLFVYLPRLVGAGILLFLAWLVANLLKLLVVRATQYLHLDKKLQVHAGLEHSEELPLEKTLSESIYWLSFLLFLPAILNSLGLEGLLQPVQNMLNQILSYLPKLLAAGLILSVGWLVARVVQRVISNLLNALGVDRFVSQTGLVIFQEQKQPVSALIGLIVYTFILIPVVISALNALELAAITEPASKMLSTILNTLPSIFAAVLLISIAYIIGKIIVSLLVNLLDNLGFNQFITNLGFTKLETLEQSPSVILGHFFMTVVLLFASMEAFELMGLQKFSSAVSVLLQFLVQLVLALFIFGVGFYLSKLASRSVQEQSPLFALIARIAILSLSGAMALRQIGLAGDIITLSFAFVLGSAAVAIALAVGLGSRSYVETHVSQWISNAFPNVSTLQKEQLGVERHNLVVQKIFQAQEAEKVNTAFFFSQGLEKDLLAIQNRIQQLGNYSEEQQKQEIEGLNKILGQTLQSVQRSVDLIHPMILNDLGLQAALEELVKSSELKSGLETQLQIQLEGIKLNTNKNAQIYRICQHLIHYLTSFSGTQKLRLNLSAESGELYLILREDGSPITLKEVQSANNMALIEFYERLTSVQGQLELKNQGNINIWSIKLPV